MNKIYILVDLENVQPQNLEELKGNSVRIFIFVGENQTKVSVDLASDLQAFGDAARYIQISGSGKNSLDFHIAYFLGELTSQDPEAHYHIISKDKGFDPLVKFLTKSKKKVFRHDDLSQISGLKMGIVGSQNSVSIPVNHGKQWTPEEEKQLVSRFHSQLSIEDIAKKHKRGIGSIQARLTKLGILKPEGGQEMPLEIGKNNTNKIDANQNRVQLPSDFDPYVVDLKYTGTFGSDPIKKC